LIGFSAYQAYKKITEKFDYSYDESGVFFKAHCEEHRQ